MKFIFKGILVVVAALSMASCSTYKNINYIQDVEANVSQEMAINKGILIQPKDMISIVVSSRNNELAKMFNLPVANVQAGAETGVSYTPRIVAYVVDNEGFIDFPVLGEIQVAGLNRWELAKLIKNRLVADGYLSDPVVTVQFMNFKISVLGEVASPGTYTIDGDKIKTCIHCKTCSIMSGFGGAGAFSGASV